MQVFYNQEEIKPNSYLDKGKAQTEPFIKLGEKVPESTTLIMYDPDAVGGTYLHWIVQDYFSPDNKKVILSYQGPAPPKGTGMHNYIFSLYTGLTIPSEFNERKVGNINEITSGIQPIKTISFKSSTPDGGKRRKTKTCKERKRKFKKSKRRKMTTTTMKRRLRKGYQLHK